MDYSTHRLGQHQKGVDESTPAWMYAV